MATQTEGNLVNLGGGSATPNPSGTEGQPSGDNLTPMEVRMKALEGEIKALKSGKDAAVNRVEKAGNQLLEYAKYLGVDEDKIKEAQRTMAIDELVAQKYGVQSAPVIGNNAVQTPVVEVTKIASQYGLGEEDQSFIASLGNETDADKVELAIARSAKEKKNQPSPTPAQQTAPTGGHVAPQVDEKALTDELEVLQKTPSKHQKRIKEIEEKLGW